MSLFPAIQAAPSGSDTTEAPAANTKAARWFELALVLFVLFGGALVSSIGVLKYGTGITGPSSNVRWMGNIVHEVGGLLLLGYVLWRRQRSFRDLGLRWAFRDLGIGVLVTLGSYVIYFAGTTALYALHHAIWGTFPHGPRAREIFGPGSVLALLFALLNPFFEELTVRAYLMTEVIELTGSAPLAVFLSVLVQSSYHLYYGWWRALSISFLFLGFSLYYARSGRALPIIVAHAVNDIYATIRLF